MGLDVALIILEKLDYLESHIYILDNVLLENGQGDKVRIHAIE